MPLINFILFLTSIKPYLFLGNGGAGGGGGGGGGIVDGSSVACIFGISVTVGISAIDIRFLEAHGLMRLEIGARD